MASPVILAILQFSAPTISSSDKPARASASAIVAPKRYNPTSTQTWNERANQALSGLPPPPPLTSSGPASNRTTRSEFRQSEPNARVLHPSSMQAGHRGSDESLPLPPRAPFMQPPQSSSSHPHMAPQTRNQPQKIHSVMEPRARAPMPAPASNPASSEMNTRMPRPRSEIITAGRAGIGAGNTAFLPNPHPNPVRRSMPTLPPGAAPPMRGSMADSASAFARPPQTQTQIQTRNFIPPPSQSHLPRLQQAQYQPQSPVNMTGVGRRNIVNRSYAFPPGPTMSAAPVARAEAPSTRSTGVRETRPEMREGPRGESRQGSMDRSFNGEQRADPDTRGMSSRGK